MVRVQPATLPFELKIEAVEHHFIASAPISAVKLSSCTHPALHGTGLQSTAGFAPDQGGTRINNNEVFEVQNTFEVLQGHVQQQTDPAWQ